MDANRTGTTETSAPGVWLLLGARLGDNNQLLALGEGLGLPFEIKSLSFNPLHHLRWRWLGLRILSPQSRRAIRPPWPQLVVSIAFSSVAVARHIRGESKGRTRLVHIGNPRSQIDDLDLVILTPQYIRGEAPNILTIPFPIGNPGRMASPAHDEDEWLRGFPRPRRLVAVGGWTRNWTIDHSQLDRAIEHLKRLNQIEGGSIIAITSPRTTSKTRRRLQARLTGPTEAVVDHFPRFGVLLDACDECYVTADSVSMLSEAILMGKPVGMIPIARSLRGAVGHWIKTAVWNFRSHSDLSRFWRYLEVEGLVGSVDSPVASRVSDTIGTAVSAVRRVIDGGSASPGP